MTGRRNAGGTRGAWARAALPLALACLLLQLGSAAHLVLSPHSICAEHGEVTDGAAPHPGARALPVARSGSLSSPGPLAQAGDHEHSHCLLASHRRDAATTPRDSVRVPPCTRASDACTGSQHARACSPIDLVLVAPKSSPPAALAV